MPIFSAYIANSASIIPKILEVHLPKGGLIADVTYGLGVFWRKMEGQETQDNLFLDAPYHVVTSDRVQPAMVRADFTCLPYRNSQFDCVFLDPPWGNLSTAPRNQGINERYQIPPMSVAECRALYTSGMRECSRILKAKGLLVIKCQDQVCSGKKHWFSVDIFRHGESLGFNVIDRMIQVGNGADVDSQDNGLGETITPEHQEHFRARESLYWIMKKKRASKTKRKETHS